MNLRQTYFDGQKDIGLLPFLVPEKVLFVSPSNTVSSLNVKPNYDDLQDAIDDSDGDTTIIVFPGVYTGNYTVDVGCNIHFLNGAVLTPTTTSSPALTITASCKITGSLVVDYTPSSTYAIDITAGLPSIEAHSVCQSLGLNAIRISSVSTAIGIFDIKYLGTLNISSSGSIRFNCKQIDNIYFSGSNECYLNAQVVTGFISVTSGKIFIRAEEYLEGTDYLALVSGGTLIMSGRVANYANTTTNTTGVGYTFKVLGTGLLILKDVQCRNTLGGNLWLGGGEARLQNVVFESGGGGGGGVACIDSPPPGAGLIRHIGNVTLRVGVGNIGSELITANKTVDANTRV